MFLQISAFKNAKLHTFHMSACNCIFFGCDCIFLHISSASPVPGRSDSIPASICRRWHAGAFREPLPAAGRPTAAGLAACAEPLWRPLQRRSAAAAAGAIRLPPPLASSRYRGGGQRPQRRTRRSAAAAEEAKQAAKESQTTEIPRPCGPCRPPVAIATAVRCRTGSGGRETGAEGVADSGDSLSAAIS